MDIQQALNNMIEQQIKPYNVHQKRLLHTMANVNRQLFVLPQYQKIAFADLEIILPNKAKMFTPKIDALLIQALDLDVNDKVFEIGTGSGYVTTILAKLAGFVYSIEIDPDNRSFAMQNLTNIELKNVTLHSGNGLYGLIEGEPFNKIFVGGGLKQINDTLKNKLVVGGILVAIIGEFPVMHAIKLTRVNLDEYKEEILFETVAGYLITHEIDKFNF